MIEIIINSIAWFYGFLALTVPENPLWIIVWWIAFVYLHYRLLGVFGGIAGGIKYWVFDDMSWEGFKYGYEVGNKITRFLFFGWAVYGTVFR